MSDDLHMQEIQKTARRFRLLVIISLLTLGVGTTVFHYVEDWGWIDAFYFSGVSLTTVGYGDITPVTDLGKILVVIYLFLGIGIIAGLVNNFIKGLVARQKISRHHDD